MQNGKEYKGFLIFLLNLWSEKTVSLSIPLKYFTMYSLILCSRKKDICIAIQIVSSYLNDFSKFTLFSRRGLKIIGKLSRMLYGSICGSFLCIKNKYFSLINSVFIWVGLNFFNFEMIIFKKWNNSSWIQSCFSYLLLCNLLH